MNRIRIHFLHIFMIFGLATQFEFEFLILFSFNCFCLINYLKILIFGISVSCIWLLRRISMSKLEAHRQILGLSSSSTVFKKREPGLGRVGSDFHGLTSG